MIGGLALLISGVLLCAAGHKAQLLRTSQAYQHRVVMAVPLLAARPRVWLAIATATEFLLVVLVWLASPAGFTLTCCMVAAYTVALSHLAPGEDCDCFGPYAAMDRASAIRRNLVLLGLSALGLSLALLGNTPRVNLISVAIALFLASPVLAHGWLRVATASTGTRRQA